MAKAFTGDEIDEGMRNARRIEPEPSRELATGGFMGASVGGELALHAGTAAAVSREQAELQASLFLARTNPRDEARCFTKIMASCKRPLFAEGAQYKFPRGGSQISGPSVELAREMARVWGNMRSGHRIVSVDAEHVHIKGFCHDLETNNYKEEESKFRRRVQRKVRNEQGVQETRWVEPDERDLRELVNKQGAICERNSILRCMPPDIIEEACRASDETIKKAAKGEIEQDRAGALRRMALAFVDLGVTTEMIREYVGHDLDALTPEELTDLRGIYKSISDGNSRREEYFAVGKPAEKTAPTGSKSRDMLNELKGGKPAETDAGPTPPPETIGADVKAHAEKLDQLRENATAQAPTPPLSPPQGAGGTALFDGGSPKAARTRKV